MTLVDVTVQGVGLNKMAGPSRQLVLKRVAKFGRQQAKISSWENIITCPDVVYESNNDWTPSSHSTAARFQPFLFAAFETIGAPGGTSSRWAIPIKKIGVES